MRCPYCENEIASEVPCKGESSCESCGETFSSGLTDFNNHSPHEVSESLPYTVFLHGSITQLLFRKDQRLCEICGSIYQSRDKVCPQLKASLRRWYKQPKDIIEKGSSVSAELVRAEIENYLAKNVKRKVWPEILGK